MRTVMCWVVNGAIVCWDFPLAHPALVEALSVANAPTSASESIVVESTAEPDAISLWYHFSFNVGNA